MGNNNAGAKNNKGSDIERRSKAVVYARVSSMGQVNTDRDGEGFSIGAQRDACIAKAESMNADVLEVYVDAGESARKADRPQLQAMLDRLKTERDADFVIVHKVDRLARNRGDDVEITLAIRQSGAQLVSVTEQIDETPSGMLLHGIMSTIAEYYSQNLSNEIIKGTSKKAERGAYPGMAPVGYLNRQDLSGGNQLRWIEIDEERAPHVSWAFEVYANGDYSLRQLVEALEARGLRSRTTPKRTSQPFGLSQVHRMLANRFYMGRFLWGGAEYQGNHEPLVDIDTFAKVQALLHARNQAGEKPQHHEHYLKGTIFCARCGSRMIFSRNHGHGGVYDYFVCIGRHGKHNACDLPYISAEEIERHVEDYYENVVIDERTMRSVYKALLAAAKKRNSRALQMVKRERKRVLDLEQERRSLLKAHLAGAVPLELLKEEQDRIGKELADAGAVLANTEVHWETLERNLEKALLLTSRISDAYRKAEPNVRRQLNQAVFKEIQVDLGGTVMYARVAEPFSSFNDREFRAWLTSGAPTTVTSEDPGSNMSRLVEAMGLEPTTSCLQSRCSSQLSYAPEFGNLHGTLIMPIRST